MMIDHVGVVVRSLESGIRDWKSMFGYEQSSPIIANSRQKVRVVFLAKRDSVLVKLIEPSGPDSPVHALARRGGGLHHLCFRCDDLARGVKHMQANGARLLVAPEPGEAFLDHDIAFLITTGNLAIELIDRTEKAKFLRLRTG